MLTALVQDSDPAQLEGLAVQLSPKYPMAGSELRAKGAELRGAVAAPPGVASPRRGTAVRPTGTSSPDLSEAALVLQAAMKAYAEETDPVALEGFADSIRAKFPTGAILLLGRARELHAEHGPAAGAPGAAGGLAGAAGPPALPAAPPRTATYVVQPGDTPTLIAQRLTRDGARWPELVPANPSKPLAHDGTFASLRPGEAVSLPASWTTPAAPVVDVAITHPEGQS